MEQIVWDEELDTMSREKKAAEATWGELSWSCYSCAQSLEYTDLKTRFRAKSEKLKAKPVKPTTAAAKSRKQGNRLTPSPFYFMN